MLLCFFVVAICFVCCVKLQNQELTHIVMPFHPRQVKQAIENINKWSVYTPCHLPRNVSLIFYLAKNEPIGVKGLILDQFEKIPNSVKNCFDSIEVTHEPELETHDSYLFGSRLMFEKMVSGKLNYGHKSPSFVMYMEPDCVPVKKYWLDVLIDAVRPPNEYFWMKGSSFRGNIDAIQSNPPAYTLLHINGNALYNVGDGKLFSFYENQVKPFLEKNKASEAYDSDFFKFLLWSPETNAAQYLHLFVHTDLIQNKWHSVYSDDEIYGSRNATVLVHGGKAISQNGKH